MRQRFPLYAAWVGYGALLLSTLITVILLPVEAGGFLAYITRQDFVGVYLGAKLMSTGQGQHLYDMAAQYRLQESLIAPYAPIVHTLYYIYPGWIALVLAPIGLLTYPMAFSVWTGVNILAGAVSIVRLVKAFAVKLRWTLQEQSIFVLLAVGFVPLWYTLWQGQTAIVVLLGLTCAILALRAGQERKAGAWLIFCLIKPQLIVLPVLVLFLAKRWRALGVLCLGVAGLLGASFLALGNWLPSYVLLLRSYVQEGAVAGDDPAIMHNWRGLVYRLFGNDSGAIDNGLVIGLTILSVAAVVVMCWSRSKPELTGPTLEVKLAVAILLGLLADPHFYLQDAAIALVPGFVLWYSATGPGLRLRILRIILAAGPFIARIALSWAPPVVEIGSWYLVLLLLSVLWAWPVLPHLKPLELPGQYQEQNQSLAILGA